MTMRDKVFNVLQGSPEVPFSIKGVNNLLSEYSYEQVANCLADIAAFDERVTRTARGVYVYGATESLPPFDEQIEKALEELTSDQRADEHMYFTQVGVAENGDLILSRDSDTRVYRATPV